MLFFAPNVTPLDYKGIRYQQDSETDFEGREDGATYLSATDIQTNTPLWFVKICDCIKEIPGGPRGIIFVDISKITLGPNEDELTVETMAGTRHLIDLKKRTVTLIFSPDWNPKPVYPSVKGPQPPMPPPMPRRRKR